MAQGLVAAGAAVHIVATDDNGSGRLNVPLGEPIQQDGFTIRYFPRQTRFYTISWPLTLWLAQHITDYDLVHIHALFSYAALPAAFLAASSKTPYIVRPLGVLNQWGMQNRRPLLKRLSFSLIERHILNHAALIHYTSEQEQVEASQLGISSPSAVLPLGTNFPKELDNESGHMWYQSRFPDLTGRLIILFLSRLDPKKGLDLLLPAFARLRKQMPNVALVLAGDGDPRFISTMRQQIESLDLTSDVYWAGFLQGNDKYLALAGANIFALPSYSENYGVSVVEAMACKVPVVISDQVGLCSDVALAEAGIVVPCQIAPLAEALFRLASDDKLRLKLGRNGRQLAQEHFSLEVTTRKLIQIYSSITGIKSAVLEASE
jgi:glycosyltransferase involved in cell wall biosynthesis